MFLKKLPAGILLLLPWLDTTGCSKGSGSGFLFGQSLVAGLVIELREWVLTGTLLYGIRVSYVILGQSGIVKRIW
jgi:hypothetical protein